MCNDIPRNRLHRKMFGELIAEGLHRTLSTSIAHQHLLRVLGSWRAANPNQPVAQLRFQRCTWQTWRFLLGCVGSRSTKTLENMSILGCACVKMEPFVLLFFPKFCSTFRVKIGHFPLQCSVFGV